MTNKLALIAGFSLLATPFAMTLPAHAETIGLSCPTGAMVAFTPAGEAYELADDSCEVSFEVAGGYWAVAESEDGQIQGASGGYSSQAGADAAAIAACEAEGAESCAVSSYGFDDGSGPAMMDEAEEDAEEVMMEAEEAEMEMASEEMSDDMMVEEEVVEDEEEMTLRARIAAVVVVFQVSEDE